MTPRVAPFRRRTRGRGAPAPRDRDCPKPGRRTQIPTACGARVAAGVALRTIRRTTAQSVVPRYIGVNGPQAETCCQRLRRADRTGADPAAQAATDAWPTRPGFA